MQQKFYLSMFTLVVSVVLLGAGCANKAPSVQPEIVPDSTVATPTAEITTPVVEVSTPTVETPVVSGPADKLAVAIKDFSFQPDSPVVDLGTIVTWTNNDSVPHTITADNGSFDSGTIPAGGTYSHTFVTAETVSYYCAFHRSMRGSIIVGK